MKLRKFLAVTAAVAIAAVYMPLNTGAAFAETDVDAAKAAYEEAKAEYREANQAKTEAQARVDAADEALAGAKADAEQLVAEIRTEAAETLTQKQQAAEDAATQYASAEREYNQAQTEYSDAVAANDIEALTQAVFDAEASASFWRSQLRDAEADLADAQAAYNNVGRAFINEKAGTEVSIEDLAALLKSNNALKDYIGTDKYNKTVESALTVQNLNAAADFVAECNELRAGHGAGPLKINYRLMILSAVSAGVSSQVHAHAVIEQVYNGALESLEDVMPMYPSENLSWGYSDPFAGWYTKEKSSYNNYVKQHPEIADMDSYELMQTYPDIYQKVGHYLNIIDADMAITGYARATSQGTMDEQCFDTGDYGDFGESVTPQQFKADLASYSSDAEDAVTVAQSDKETASSNITAADAALQDAQSALQNAQNEINQKKSARDSAEAALSEAEAAKQTADAQLADAEDAKAKADAIDLENPDTFSDYAELVEAAEKIAAAEEDLAQANAQLQDCITTLNEKEAAFEEAKAAYEALVGEIKISLTEAEITGLQDMTYTGKELAQESFSVTVDGEAIDEANYIVSYENNVKIGTATITLTGQNQCEDSISASFRIIPKGTKLTKLSKGKKKMTVKWKRQKTQVTGYQIQYSQDSSFETGVKTVTITKSKTTSKTIKKLKSKKKYYARVCTYKKVGGEKYCSEWSNVKSVKIK
ncbi:MAG: fibronectin type III domain-containing protein [Bacillota bacterium]|nr:fibronectin type III domain-containing protein [Bacillota bacterium]